MSNLLINLSILFSQPTGISNYTQNLFPYLKNLKPTLLTAQIYPEFNCYSIPNNLTPAQGTKGHFSRLLWTQFKLPKIYQKLKANLLFSPVPEAPLNSKCRYVVTVHDVIPLRFPQLSSPLLYYHRYYIPQVLQQAQHIICNSQSTARDITKFYSISASKITPILLAYDDHNFRFLGQNTSSYFLYLGRHDPYKNLHRLIAAFAALSNNQDYQLWIAGSPDARYTPALKVQATELGILNQVKFLDYVPYNKLPKIINQAIALVFPSLWEGFGLPVLEAMACGTPVITSNLSSLPEVAGDAAILVNPYNTSEITKAMNEVAKDTSLRDRLSNLCIARANQFSWDKAGKETAQVLEKYL